MKREEVVRIQNRARAIMQYTPEQLKQKLKGRKLSILYYYIFEDANYHTENNILSMMGVFGKFHTNHYESGDVTSPDDYGSSGAESLWKAYRNAKGKTYEL